MWNCFNVLRVKAVYRSAAGLMPVLPVENNTFLRKNRVKAQKMTN